jgi:membrane protein
MPKTNPLDRFFGWFFELFPVRVFLAFGGKNGYVLAAGLAYQALFALFAALWSGFSVAGLVLAGSPALQDSLFDVINTSVPGLIKSGSDASGAIDATKLLHAGIFGFTGAVAVVVLVWTAVGFLGSARGSVRTIFGVAQSTEDFFVRKGKDILLGLLFGVAVLLSSVLSLVSTSSVRFLLGLVGADSTAIGATILLRIVGLLVVFAFDTVVLMGLFKVLSGLFIPRRRLITGSLLGAAALGVLKVVGGSLLGHTTTNPLLASFAVILRPPSALPAPPRRGGCP